MSKPKMNVKEITVGLSGVIPIASYENFRPSFSITAEPIDGENPDKIITSLQEYLHRLMMEESNRSKAEAIEKMYAQIRLYEKGNKKYPSVTSILGWDKDWHGMTDDDLLQYASRGKILEYICTYYLLHKEWVDPETVDVLKEDLAILKRGSRQLSWQDNSCKAFMEKYAEIIVVEQFQKTVFNEEHNYAGTMDIVGLFDGKKSIMDFKSGTHDWRQLAAYAICEDNIEQLVILHIGPTDNKCGYKKPTICTTIETEFKAFLKARAKFRHRYGI